MGRPISDILCTAAAAIAIALGSAKALAQQPPAWGPSLFAPSLEAGRAIDAGRKLTVTPFYTKPASEPPARPGTLVRAEPAADFALPPGVTATRILYHTRTADDTDTLATGVVLVPYGHPPPGGWPLLAWSHGTSGVAMSCAPSLMKSLFYDWQGLYEYVTLGYAVVATDYAGLGTTSRHAYLDILSNATDVVHSVSAAHAAVPNLSGKWIVVGHSQGGLSSLGVAELEARIKDPDFLGAVALAGASDLSDAINSILSVKLPVLNGLVAFWIYGVETVYPKFKPKDVLTPTAYSTYVASVDDGCSAASGAFAAMPTDRMLVPGWRRNRYIKQFMERNRPGSLPTLGPLLLVGGGNDVLFTEAAGRKIVDRICAAGGQLQWKVYPALGHDEVVYGSLKDQIGWIADRFDGKAAPNDCASR